MVSSEQDSSDGEDPPVEEDGGKNPPVEPPKEKKQNWLLDFLSFDFGVDSQGVEPYLFYSAGGF